MSTFGAPALLNLINDDERRALVRLSNRVTYSNGELVHDRGDVGTALGIVVSGRVNLYRTRTNGTLVFASAVDAGQNFGDVVSMTGANRTHHAVAEGQTVVDHLGQSQLDRILIDHPTISLALYKVASYRLKTAIDMLDDARMLKTEVRLAKMLRRMVSAEPKLSTLYVPTYMSSGTLRPKVLGICHASRQWLMTRTQTYRNWREIYAV